MPVHCDVSFEKEWMSDSFGRLTTVLTATVSLTGDRARFVMHVARNGPLQHGVPTWTGTYSLHEARRNGHLVALKLEEDVTFVAGPDRFISMRTVAHHLVKVGRAEARAAKRSERRAKAESRRAAERNSSYMARAIGAVASLLHFGRGADGLLKDRALSAAVRKDIEAEEHHLSCERQRRAFLHGKKDERDSFAISIASSEFGDAEAMRWRLASQAMGRRLMGRPFHNWARLRTPMH